MKLYKYRTQKNLTQVEMAAKLNITQPHYANIENGIRTPSARLIQRIERATDNAVRFRDFYPSAND